MRAKAETTYLIIEAITPEGLRYVLEHKPIPRFAPGDNEGEP